jgi:hypothetical protein
VDFSTILETGSILIECLEMLCGSF